MQGLNLTLPKIDTGPFTFRSQMKATKPAEWYKCQADPAYFIHEHTMIFNATNERWEPFRLWPAQGDVLGRMTTERLLIVLKARQLGLTWLCLAYALWRMLFRPAATVGIFSRIETDAQDLLDARLKGIYARLPEWAKVGAPWSDSKSYWKLPNGSTARAFATNGGRSYTFSLVMVDEADFQPDFPLLLNAVEPTIDAGGQLLLISTIDKSKPNSRFKAIYRAAKAGDNDWSPVFLPWHARPERTPDWYAGQAADTLANTGSLDDLHQEYPATDTEALSPRTLDKRIPAPWIEACFVEADPIDDPAAPSIPGLTVYQPPQPGRSYVIGGDPAEGNPTSDDSAATVLDALSGEEVARLRGKIQPTTFAGYIIQIAHYYHNAAMMVERNNHGHAVLQYIEEHGRGLALLPGHDDRPGWLSSALGKTLLYNEAADAYREGAQAGAVLLHSFDTYTQLASIEGSSLRAPDGEHDDLADSDALARVGMVALAGLGHAAVSQSPVRNRGGSPNVRRSTRRVAS